MFEKKVYQQGDVLIELIETIPTDAVKAKRTVMGAVLAEGEATGHFHKTIDPGVDMYGMGDQLFMCVDNPEGKCNITHDEHHAVDVPNGNYEVRKVQEYDHFAEEARAVQD